MSHPETLSLSADTVPRQLSLVWQGAIVAGATLLIALSAQVSVTVPFSAVPLTLQPLAILLLGSLLGWKRGALAGLLYLAEGAAGLPVFSHGMNGVAFAGATAGYLFTFPLVMAVAGLTLHRSFFGRLASMLLALSILYVGGWSWLAAELHLGAAKAFAVGVVPFVLADLCKAVLAALIASGTTIHHEPKPR